ncbi:MAG: hypothetical protein IK058_02110 [Bacteroidales bacterium]|nr:hypothetical protein [Bacteroidales bacterium]
MNDNKAPLVKVISMVFQRLFFGCSLEKTKEQPKNNQRTTEEQAERKGTDNN